MCFRNKPLREVADCWRSRWPLVRMKIAIKEERNYTGVCSADRSVNVDLVFWGEEDGYKNEHRVMPVEIGRRL